MILSSPLPLTSRYVVTYATDVTVRSDTASAQRYARGGTCQAAHYAASAGSSLAASTWLAVSVTLDVALLAGLCVLEHLPAQLLRSMLTACCLADYALLQPTLLLLVLSWDPTPGDTAPDRNPGQATRAPCLSSHRPANLLPCV